jgi:hypothetical protein
MMSASLWHERRHQLVIERHVHIVYVYVALSCRQLP